MNRNFFRPQESYRPSPNARLLRVVLCDKIQPFYLFDDQDRKILPQLSHRIYSSPIRTIPGFAPVRRSKHGTKHPELFQKQQHAQFSTAQSRGIKKPRSGVDFCTQPIMTFSNLTVRSPFIQLIELIYERGRPRGYTVEFFIRDS